MSYPLARYIGLGPAPGPFAYWPVIGLMFGLFYRRPYGEWVWIGIVSSVAQVGIIMLIRGGVAGGSTIFGTVVGIAMAMLGALLMRRVGSQERPLASPLELGWFMIGAVLLIPFVLTPFSAFYFAFGLKLSFMATWVPLFAGDSLSVLLFAPLIMQRWRAPDEGRLWPRPPRIVEITLCQVLLAAAAIVAFNDEIGGVQHTIMPAAVFPLLAWAALRCGPRWTATGVLAIATIACWYTARGSGPFVNPDTPFNERILHLQIFLAIVAFTALLLSALIEQRRRAAREVALQHAVQRAFLESSTALMSLKNLAGESVLMNAAASAVGSVAAGGLRDEEKRVLERGVPLTFDRVVIVKGQERHFVFTYFPVRDEHDIIHYVGMVGRDDTAEHTVSERLHRAQRVELLGQLAAGLAHDLNNLLTIVVGNAEFLRTLGTFSEDDERSLQDIHEASMRATQLTRRMLELSRTRSENRIAIPVDDAVRAMEPMLRALARGNIDLVLDTNTRGACIYVDPVHFEQMVLNLVSNARDAVNGAGRITIATELIPADDRTVARARITVADTGVGMNEETLAHLFDAFFSTKAEQGTGLGLFTTATFVRESGGMIQAASTLGQGSALTVEFPVVV